MPIDPNTGMYVDPLGTNSPGGMGSAGLTILSNMLATNLAATKRQDNELDLAKKQHDFDRQLDYEGAIDGASDEQIPDVAARFSSPNQAMTQGYSKAYREDALRQKENANAIRMEAESTKIDDLAVKAGMTNLQRAQLRVSRGVDPQDVLLAWQTSPNKDLPFAPATAAKMNLQGAQATNQVAQAGKANVVADDIEATRPARIKEIEARSGLANERARISRLKNTVDALKKAQAAGAGKIDAKRFDALRREKESVLGKIDSIRRSLRGNAGLLVDEKDRQDAESTVNELQAQVKAVESEMAGIKTSVDFSDVTSGHSATPSPAAANADVPPGFRPGDTVIDLTK